MRYSIDEVVINNVLGYLGERPFKEVAQIITALHNDAKPLAEAVGGPDEPVNVPSEPAGRVVAAEIITVDEGESKQEAPVVPGELNKELNSEREDGQE